MYAMAGSIEHLIRIVTDMTNAFEDLEMKWKEKSLKVVAGPYAKYKPGQTVEVVSKSGKQLHLARDGGHGGAGYVAGQSRMFRGENVAQDLEGELHVL